MEKQIEKAMDYLKSRAVSTREVKGCEHVKLLTEVVPVFEVISILEMIKANELDAFLIKIKNISG